MASHPGGYVPIRGKSPGFVCPRRLSFSLLPARRPDCGDSGHPKPLSLVHLFSGARFHNWLLGGKLMPVPRLSQGPQPHNERAARGVLADMENICLGARPRASQGRHHNPRLPVCRLGRRADASCSRNLSPPPLGIVQLVTCYRAGWHVAVHYAPPPSSSLPLLAAFSSPFTNSSCPSGFFLSLHLRYIPRVCWARSPPPPQLLLASPPPGLWTAPEPGASPPNHAGASLRTAPS